MIAIEGERGRQPVRECVVKVQRVGIAFCTVGLDDIVVVVIANRGIIA